jgi:hypothetical protein
MPSPSERPFPLWWLVLTFAGVVGGPAGLVCIILAQRHLRTGDPA